MIYIVTALYAEAHPFITRFQMKKDSSHTRFQVFLNREANLCLIISGTGSVPSVAAVSSICTEYGTGPRDFLLNTGICAQILSERETPYSAGNPCRTGQIFLCSKIREQVTGRTFYPDLLYRHRFAEAQIITGARPYEKSIPAVTRTDEFLLYDMEAAAVYQAGSYYFGPHQMSFLKIISDNGNPEHVTSEQIEHLIHRNMDSIADYIASLQTILQEACQDELLAKTHREETLHTEHQPESFQKESLLKELEQLCDDLHCSRTMAQSLRQHIRYCILSGVDYASVLKAMYQEGKLPCRDKREGKQCFEELKKRLL